MTNKEFKYLEYLGEIANCPPEKAIEKNIDAYRWVFSDIANADNFIPPNIKKPSRANTKDDSRKCSNYALSFFTREDGAIGVYKKYLGSFKNFPESVGDHLAFGNITEEDGVCTEESESSHFDLHEYKGSRVSSTFKILKRIM